MEHLDESGVLGQLTFHTMAVFAGCWYNISDSRLWSIWTIGSDFR